jgi:hypothetical protein
MSGLNGGEGDHAFIKRMMDTRNLHLVDHDDNGVMLFLDGDQYGQSMTIMHEASEVRAALAPAIRACLCGSQELGELILDRQLYMLQTLNIVVEDMLDLGSSPQDCMQPSRQPDKAAVDALSKLRIQ